MSDAGMFWSVVVFLGFICLSCFVLYFFMRRQIEDIDRELDEDAED